MAFPCPVRRDGISRLLGDAEGLRPAADRLDAQHAPTTGIEGGALAVATSSVVYDAADATLYAFDAAGSLNGPVTDTGKTCTPSWSQVTGFTTRGSAAIASGVLFVNAPGNGAV